jgi:hypothetical protein
MNTATITDVDLNARIVPNFIDHLKHSMMEALPSASRFRMMRDSCGIVTLVIPSIA